MSSLESPALRVTCLLAATEPHTLPLISKNSLPAYLVTAARRMQAGQAARVLVSLHAQEVRQRVRRVRAVRRVDFRSGGVGMKQRCRATRLHIGAL